LQDDQELADAVQKSSTGATLNTWQYGFDAAGNMTSKTASGTTTGFTYNAANEMTAAGSTTYSYDATGAQTGSSTGENISYNSAQQTTSLTPSGGSPLTQTFSGIGQLYHTQSGSTSYQNDATGVSAQTTSGSTTYYTRAPDGTLLSERSSSGTSYYLTDGQSSVVAVADSSGNVQNRYSYDPSGSTTSCSQATPNSITFGGAVSLTVPCGSQSPWLYLPNYQRYYDPSTAPPTCPGGAQYISPSVAGVPNHCWSPPAPMGLIPAISDAGLPGDFSLIETFPYYGGGGGAVDTCLLWFLCSSGGGGTRQLKKLTAYEIGRLKRNDIDPEELKEEYGCVPVSRCDLYKDQQQWVYVAPKGNLDAAQKTWVNLRQLPLP
jgi:hypothetical protein